MVVLILKILLYGLGVAGVMLIVREMHYIRRRSPPPLLQQANHWFRESKPQVARLYSEPKWEMLANEAGLSPMAALSYKLVRDVGFLLLVIIIHVRFLMTGEYPVVGMILIAISYLMLLTGHALMPANLFLRAVGKDRKQQKNDEIVLLFMLFSNDTYTETADHYQSVLAKLKEYRKYLKVLRKDVDQLIFDLPLDGPVAFKAFEDRIGSKEAKRLAIIMAKINESNPEAAADLLGQHYDTFLDFRRQRRKRKLRSNGYIGFTVVFLAIVAVLFLISSISGAYTNKLMDVL